jgi:hypothetical protein
MRNAEPTRDLLSWCLFGIGSLDPLLGLFCRFAWLSPGCKGCDVFFVFINVFGVAIRRYL